MEWPGHGFPGPGNGSCPMREIDWPAMRWPIALFVLALAAGAVTAGVGVRFHDEMERGYEREKGMLESIRTRYRNIGGRKRLIETWLPAFRALEASGVVGEERRLAWIETLRGVAARVKLPSLRYRIERRVAYESADLLPGDARYRPFSTVVRIEAGLLHEGDLERLIGALDTPGVGLHRIDRCDVARAGPEFEMRPDAINLTAGCDLRWITLRRVEEGT